MAKVSPVSIKYMIHASFKSEGPLEKPDVIGAIFGQTEGLLGSDLEMRELQKEGRIGRIEVELETVDGKSVGVIKLPSALDKSETTLVAAALETIDRIGPTEAKIEIIKVEDVRGSKRDYILERAKRLLENLEGNENFEEMSKSVREDVRSARIQEYGDEKLPAGDLSGNEVVVVEGRADVVNLLKNRVNNVIGMNGTKLPAAIAQLGQTKELTLFVDGDRGGKLIAMNVIRNARIAYLAVAPDGKEVEELVGKEILLSLRKRIPSDEFIRRNRYESYSEPESATVNAPKVEYAGNVKEDIRKAYEKIKDSKSAVLVDSKFDVIKRVSSREVTRSLMGSRTPVFAIIIDGSAVGPTIRACDERGVQYLAALNFSSVENPKVNLISL